MRMASTPVTTSKTEPVVPMPATVRNPTNADAPPPRPLRRPTICGICIICTRLAIIQPMPPPMSRHAPTAMYVIQDDPAESTVARMARVMAKMLNPLPLTAVCTRLIMMSPTRTSIGIMIIKNIFITHSLLSSFC